MKAVSVGMDVLYASPGISTDFLALFKNQRRCDSWITVNASTLQGFRNLVLAIVLKITVYKTPYTIIAGADCEVQ